MTRLPRFITDLGVLTLLLWTTSVLAEDSVVTFFATSDSHYEAITKVERNDRNRVTMRMNELPGQTWPEKLGGGTIGKPRGVLVLGDLIDDGDKAGETEIEWRHFESHFGLDGTDALLKFPVFEGWGNHDGPPEKFIKQQRLSVQSEIKRRNAARLEKKLISNVSANGLHYSWDWSGIHFVQTNLYPADKQNSKVRYSLPWHDPQNALQFVKDDLAAHVADSGRPVIIMAHCGFDTDWWVADDWTAFYQAVKPYNVIAYFHGHSGTGVKKWIPEGETQPLDVINTGQTEKGFFVVEIQPRRMRLGYQIKKDATVIDRPEWEWKFLLDKPLSAAVPKKSEASE